ncbi:pyridoxamine 5'-phosphate oxidase family protein [Streptomyces sp. CA-132043]|uniref:pyridoxamine 5'-phosphate oxidase family protein n=1 Tax=Streptomyces sp. CA-132043 TaxID=3240048 RepID=UPI003D9139D0
MTSVHDDLCRTAARLLRANRYLTLGTASPDGVPWAVPVTYAWDDADRFYWYSASDAVHSRNITANAAVSLLFYDSRAADADGQALYAAATAEPVPEADLPAALATFYTHRYPDPALRARKARSAAEFLNTAPKRMYRATVHTYSLLHPDAHPTHGPSVPYRVTVPFSTASAAP